MRVDDAIVAYLEPAQRVALAAQMGLDWGALPGETEAQRAAALVTAVARRGQLADLPGVLATYYPGANWADLPTPLPTLRALHADLCRRLSLDGLRTLCFQLGIDFDDLPGDTKASRARELVLLLERAGRVGELHLAHWKRNRRIERGAWHRSRMWRGWPDLPLSRRNLRKLRYAMPLLALLVVALFMAADGRPLPPATLTVTPAPAVLALLNNPVATPAPSPTWVSWTWGSLSPAAGTTAQPTTGAPDTAGQPVGATVAASPAYVIVGPRGANLRQGPGAGYDVVATLRAGAQLTVRAISPTGEWYQVRLPGKGSPWIDATHAILGGGTGGLPVATAAHPTTQPATTVRPSPTSGRPVISGEGLPATPTHGLPTTTPTRTPAAPPTALPTPTVPPP